MPQSRPPSHLALFPITSPLLANLSPRNRHSSSTPLPAIQIANKLGNIAPLRLIKHHQTISATAIRQGANAQMRSRQARLAVVRPHDEGVGGDDGGIFGGPADVVAADEVGGVVLDVEVVRVAQGG